MSIENDLLREYVTRTKFQLSLTGLQITALVLYDLHDIDDIPARHIAKLLNPTSALRRKGLISTGGRIRLTEAGMHAEYRAEYQASGGRWFPVPHYCNCVSGWGTKQRAEYQASDWKDDGYATRIVVRYVTAPQPLGDQQ